MDIKSPAKFKFNKIYVLSGVGVVVVCGVLVFTFYPKNAVEKTNNSKQNNIITTMKTVDDFFNSFQKKPAPKPEPKPKPKPKVEVKVVEKPKPKLQLKFDETFNELEALSVTPITDAQDFLRLANNTAQVMTFKKFSDFDNNLFGKGNKPIESIETHYQAKNSKGSYPIDFSRVLTADRNISAILVNDINSALAGKVIAQIESNVYANQGRFILIPAGSKAIGYYQPIQTIGDTRLQIKWARILTPKGVDIAINSELSDQMGRSGLAGEVDSRFIERYGLTLLISSISAIAQARLSTSANTAVLVNTYGKDLANVSAKILDQQVDIKPVISINAGTRIQISPLEDVWFRAVDGSVVVQALNFNQGT